MKLSEVKSLTQMNELCCEDLLKCILGLSDLEAKVFKALQDGGKSRDIMELSDDVGRNRSSVQRAVKSLIALRLASRQSLSANRGRKYVYSPVPPDKVIGMLLNELDGYYSRIREMIIKFNEI